MNNAQRKIYDIHEVTNQKLQKSAVIINKEEVVKKSMRISMCIPLLLFIR